MRVAIVAPRDPIPVYSGLLERVYQLCSYLGTDHDVRVYFPADEAHQPSAGGRVPDDQPFERVGLDSRFIDYLGSVISTYSALKGLYRQHLWLYPQLRKRFTDFNPDAVIVEMPYLGPVSVLAARDLDAKLILSEHNVEYTFARRLEFHLWSLLKRYEIFVCNRMDVVVAVSETDATTLRSDLGDVPVTVAPNGVDIERYRPHDSEEVSDLRERYGLDGPTFVYHGHLGNAQNGEAVEWLVESVFPRVREEFPDVNLLLIGANPPNIDASGVTVTGLVEDLPRHVGLADAALVPLRSGSGTKLKILEYLASGVPVVTTSVGAEGLPLVDGEDVIIGETTEALADGAKRLVGDRLLSDQLAMNGRELVKAQFSWSQTLSPYRTLLTEDEPRGGDRHRSEPQKTND